MPRPGEGRLWGGNGSAVPLPFLPMGVGAPVMDIGYQIFPSLSMSKAVKKIGISTRDRLYVPEPPPDTVSIAAESGRKRTRAVSGPRTADLRCGRGRSARRTWRALLFSGGFQHIFNENAISFGGIIQQNMGHGPHQFSVLQDRAAAHE